MWRGWVNIYMHTRNCNTMPSRSDQSVSCSHCIHSCLSHIGLISHKCVYNPCSLAPSFHFHFTKPNHDDDDDESVPIWKKNYESNLNPFFRDKTQGWLNTVQNPPYSPDWAQWNFLIILNWKLVWFGLVWFGGFYGISTFVGYLTPNLFLCK